MNNRTRCDAGGYANVPNSLMLGTELAMTYRGPAGGLTKRDNEMKGRHKMIGGKKLKRFGLATTLLVSVLAVALLLPGCGENPLGPQAPGIGDPLAKGKVNLDAEWVGEETFKTFEASGGYLVIERSSGQSYFYVPPGALEEPVTITAKAKEKAKQKSKKKGHSGGSDPSQITVEYEFGPDGLVFGKDSWLQHRTDAPDGTVLTMWWFNPATGEWEEAATARCWGHWAFFPIHHFSKYGIS